MRGAHNGPIMKTRRSLTAPAGLRITALARALTLGGCASLQHGHEGEYIARMVVAFLEKPAPAN